MLFWANLFLGKSFSLSFYTIFFWLFKLSTIPQGQLSTFLLNFCDFCLKNTFFAIYSSKKFFRKNLRHSFSFIFTDFKLWLIILGQVRSVLLIFLLFLSKNVIFWLKNYVFFCFGEIFIFIKNIFLLSFQTNFFWFSKLSIISLGQLSIYLSNFLWFLTSKHNFRHFFI